MAAKKKSALKKSPREQVLEKLNKAGGKGETEAKLRGKNNDPEILALLKALEHEGLVKKFSSDPGTKAVTQWFMANAAPVSVLDAVADECTRQEMTLVKENDILKKLPKYYSQKEALAALKALCADTEFHLLKFKDGKDYKYLYLPDAVSATGKVGYFASETARFIYALVVLDGENQQRELELTPSHYRDKKLAKEWRDGIFKKVHPDICHHPKAHDAADALDRLYRRMIG